MSLSDLSIRRPVLTWMMTLALATFGVLGFLRLGVDQYPDMTFPFVGVMIQLEGAAPSAIEDEVVDVLEESFATIEGVRHITSQSGQGNARVMLEFELEVDLDVAANDVRDKLNVVMGELPREIEPPALGKADFSQFPIIYVPIASELSPITETTDVHRPAHQARHREHSRGRARRPLRRPRAQHSHLDRPGRPAGAEPRRE